MSITNSLAAASATSAGSETSSAARSAIASDFDAFLQMLTTQVTNQDPLSPMDSTQFVEQLATFAGLEQQLASNSHLEQIATLLQGAFGEDNAALIGRMASAAQVNAEGRFDALTVAAPGVTEGALVVRNAGGDVVYRGEPDTRWSWDGRTTNGDAVTRGTYSFEIEGPSGTVPAVIGGEIDRVVSTRSGNEIGFGSNVTAADYTLV